LGRIFVLNEILARSEYSGSAIQPLYFKSARGSPVDLLWKDTLIKISTAPKSQLAYDERALAGAMRKLKVNRALLCVPRDEVILEKKGISVVPWSYWS
jgi:predicted AAA+ superfamily ATPase